jgi:DNA mismatch endonuclease (patch repair protein)
MSDVFTKAKRSEVMSRIRSRGNKDTELALAKLLRAHGITGWRRQIEVRSEKLEVRRKLARTSRFTFRSFCVRPDFVFLKSRTALFVDGCFWHGCPQHGTQPKGNRAFWRKKLAANKLRDRLVNRTLRRAGWCVLRIWEHDLHRAIKRRATKRRKTISTPHLPRSRQKSGRGTSSGLRPPSPQSGERNLLERGGVGEARLMGRIRRALL